MRCPGLTCSTRSSLVHLSLSARYFSSIMYVKRSLLGASYFWTYDSVFPARISSILCCVIRPIICLSLAFASTNSRLALGKGSHRIGMIMLMVARISPDLEGSNTVW